MANGNNILATLERKTAISTATPERFTAIGRAADNLSRRTVDAAIVELMSEAMQRLTLLAYERDDAGYVNIDPVTWRLLIPAPHGRAGHRKWGLTRAESDVLRDMLRERQAQTDSRPPGLWLYDRTRKQWRVNLFDYDALSDGQAYWQRWPLSIQEYRLMRSRRLGR
jgi:hypothetical protein